MGKYPLIFLMDLAILREFFLFSIFGAVVEQNLLGVLEGGLVRL